MSKWWCAAVLLLGAMSAYLLGGVTPSSNAQSSDDFVKKVIEQANCLSSGCNNCLQLYLLGKCRGITCAMGTSTFTHCRKSNDTSDNCVQTVGGQQTNCMMCRQNIADPVSGGCVALNCPVGLGGTVYNSTWFGTCI
jgi:hypothetical protein